MSYKFVHSKKRFNKWQQIHFLYKMHTLVIIFIFQVKQTQGMVSNTEIDIR